MSESGAPSRWAVELHGPGRVGRALLERLAEHGIGNAGVWGPEGLRVPAASSSPRIFVDATPPRYEGEEADAWLGRLERVLERGTPVVTCNKAPLTIGWTRLLAAARRGGSTISCSAAVGGGTPILLALSRLQRSQGLTRVDASLNGTLGYVCDRVAEGVTIEHAVANAVRTGLSEPDPALDLDGTDSYAKGVILHNLLFPGERPLDLDGSRPRLRLEERRIREVATEGRPARAITSVTPRRVEVALGAFPAGAGWALGPAPVAVRAKLRDGSEAALVGPGAGPELTAGALLGDILELGDPVERAAGGIRP